MTAVAGCRNNLTFLSAQIDPYRLDTPAGHRDGAQVAHQLEGDSSTSDWTAATQALKACKSCGDLQ
jgi:hypothetical protein